MLQDGYHNLAFAKAKDAGAVAADTTSTGDAIDLTGVQAVTFAAKIVAVTAAGAKLAVEESDDGVAFTTVPDAFILDSGKAATLDGDSVVGEYARVGYNGVAKFARLAVITDATGDVELEEAVAILSYPLTAPVADTVPEGETA